MKHLQRNGVNRQTACGKLILNPELRTWNLVEVECEACQESKQYKDSEAFDDIGSKGREI